MNKYAVMVILDLNVEVLGEVNASDVEKHAETVVRAQLDGVVHGVDIAMVRAKMLGIVEEKE